MTFIGSTRPKFMGQFDPMQPPYGTPPINNPEQMQMGTIQPPMQQAAPAKTGFFGKGGVGRNIVGSIGDALMANAGMQGVYAPAQQAQMQAELENQQYQRRLQDQRSTWLQQQEYQRTNPEQTAFQKSLIAAGIDPNSDEGKRRALQFVTNQGDPEIVVPIPGRGTYIGPRSGVGVSFGAPGPSGGPQPGAVEDGFRFKGGNPADRGNWEQVGGAEPPRQEPREDIPTISQSEAQRMIGSLGQQGFQQWMRQHHVTIRQ